MSLECLYEESGVTCPNGQLMLNGTASMAPFCQVLAEAVRFELTNALRRCRFSRPVHSTTLPRFLDAACHAHNGARQGLRMRRAV